MPDLYDTHYPGDVAGHVEAGSFAGDADLINTTRGPDVLFTGVEVDREDPPRKMPHAGTEAVNKAIGETVKQAKEKGERTPVNTAADAWQVGNVALLDNNAVRLLIASPNRKSVVITNQSNATLYLGSNSGLRAQGPNTCYLPAGAGRTFEHKDEIWVVGVAGQVVDWVEENYA